MPNLFLERLKADPEYFEFWQDYHGYCKNLKIPDKQEFVDMLPALFKRIENNGASYEFYQALSKYTIKNPKDAVDILTMIEKKETKEVLNFSSSILSGLSQSETNYSYKKKILEFTSSSDENKIYSGIDAAYRVKFSDKSEEKKFLKEVHESINANLKNKSSRLLGITARFYNKYLNQIDEAKAEVLNLLELKNFSVQSEVARSLNEEFKPDEDLVYFQNCLNLLTYTDVKYQGIYRTIRYRLKELIKSNQTIILEFIDNWILNNEKNLKGISSLDGVIEDFYFEHPEVLKMVFLEWLNSENRLYKYALPYIITDLSSKVDAIGLPVKSLRKLSETDSVYIVYMIVGYILNRKYASEMLYSILEAKWDNERVRNHIATLFAKHLIKNYYSVTEILKKKRKSANKTIKSIIDLIIKDSEHYYQQVSELKLVNEFEPSDKRMQYFMKQQNLKMKKLMDSTEKKNDSFLNMLTNVNLRAGKSFFSKYRGEYSQESELQSFRSSFEVARVQSIDEIGQEKLILMWQNMKRNELPN
ncbi:hypothetical protein [Winogradskyella sp. PC D3.3]